MRDQVRPILTDPKLGAREAGGIGQKLSSTGMRYRRAKQKACKTREEAKGLLTELGQEASMAEGSFKVAKCPKTYSETILGLENFGWQLVALANCPSAANKHRITKPPS